jgi:hypothetical protein
VGIVNVFVNVENFQHLWVEFARHMLIYAMHEIFVPLFNLISELLNNFVNVLLTH